MANTLIVGKNGGYINGYNHPPSFYADVVTDLNVAVTNNYIYFISL